MTVKIGLFHPLADMRADPKVVGKIAEELGFNSYWVGEHAILPVTYESTYVGTQELEKDAPEDLLWQMPDPWIILSHVAAVTSKIRVGAGICLVPEHNPLILANEIATLDHLSGGRVNFGIGAGWNRPESEIMGVDFDHRWTQTREYVEAMKELWTTDESEYHGQYVDFPPVRCFPKPAQKPYPPIFFGSGGTQRIYKRIVEWGDGWIPLIEGPDDFAAGVRKIEALCAEKGRDPSTIHHIAFGVENQFRTKAERDALGKAGAEEVLVWIVGRELNEILDEIKHLADELL